MITAPDGSIASYDAKRTREFYAHLPPTGGKCDCAGCRNYRAAWTPDRFDSALIEACTEIGIDARKAFETAAYGGEPLHYEGELPFFGAVQNFQRLKERFHPWFFVPDPICGPNFAAGIVAIQFFIDLPWVLAGPNPYKQDMEKSLRRLEARRKENA